MAVNANTIQTYDNPVLKEDLQATYSMIDPEKTPFMTAIGTAEAAIQPHHEWTVMSLQEIDRQNRVVEGDDAPPVDPGDHPSRLSNYTQISDKRVKASHTSEASEAEVGNVHKLAKQMLLKMRALKRDQEVMLLSNVAASPGAEGVARVSAGLPAFLTSNTLAGVGGIDPTLSGGDTGYPVTPAIPGTLRQLTEDLFSEAIQIAWDNGADPTLAMVGSGNKRLISRTFTGNSTRYKDSTDRAVSAAIDVYDSDFGEKSIIPTHFLPTLNADGADNAHWMPLIDPDFLGVSYLETTKQKPLAETGHSKDRLVWNEYTLVCDNEKAHAIIRDLTNGTPVAP